MQLLDRALGDSDEPLHLCARENDVLIKSGRVTMYTRLVEGRFPKWRDVFPAAIPPRGSKWPWGRSTRRCGKRRS